MRLAYNIGIILEVEDKENAKVQIEYLLDKIRLEKGNINVHKAMIIEGPIEPT